MPVIINHDLCCYAHGTCDCSPVHEGHNVSLNIASPQKCCVEICPVNALNRNGRILVNADLCTDCGECIQICCSGAISVE